MGLVSSMKDKNGVSHDIAAKRMSGTRNFIIEGDVVGQSGDVTLENGVSINVSIQDNAVDTSCIQDGAVTNGKIYAGAVSEDKLSSEVQAKLGKAHTHDNKYKLDKYKNAGSSSVPVYIAADGTPTACTDDFARDSELSAEASARQSGDSSTLQSAKEYTDEAVASVTLDPTGDSTHAVFINAEGKPQQVDKVASASSADVAVKATNDASGNPIVSTYATKSEVTAKETAMDARVDVLEAKTKLSDFTDDITVDTYSSTSEAPISGKGVSSALGNFYGQRVGISTDGTGTKTFLVATISGNTTPGSGVLLSVNSRENSEADPIGFLTVREVSNGAYTIAKCHFDVVEGNRDTNLSFYYKIDSSAKKIYIYAVVSTWGYLAITVVSKGSVSVLLSSNKVESLPEGYKSFVYNNLVKSDIGGRGSSSVPVYVDKSGIVFQCTTSELMAGKDGSGNVITSTYATKSEVSYKNFVRMIILGRTGEVDLNSIGNVDNYSVGWYYWNSGDSNKILNKPGTTDACYLEFINYSEFYSRQICYLRAGTDYYFTRFNKSGVWSDWTKVYFDASSEYESSSVQPISGKGVASALAGYLATSRLKGSGDVASMDSDDSNAYTGKAISQKITDAIGGNIGGWLGNKSVAEINAMSSGSLNSGDYATITDNGTITLGNVSVTAGDEIYFVPSETIWQKKDNSTYVKKTDIASDKVGVVKASDDDGKVAVSSSGVMSVNGWDTLKGRVSTAESNVTTLQGTTAQHTTDIATINSTIGAMDMNQKGGDGKYIKSITQVDGKVTVEVASLDTSLSDSSGGDYAPTSAAVKDYVDAKSTEATSTANAYADEKFGSLSATYNSADESLTFDNITFK